MIPTQPEVASMRTETDSLGPVEVPADRLWGAQTQRSLESLKKALCNVETVNRRRGMTSVRRLMLTMGVNRNLQILTEKCQ